MSASDSRIVSIQSHRPSLPPFAVFVGMALTLASMFIAAGAPSPLYVVFQQEWHFPAWVLTVTFAIYAVTLLLTLVVTGSLSDHLGRRPVLIASIGLEVLSMIAFVLAPDITWVIVARAAQGVATGAATGALTAALVEVAHERHKRLAVLIGGTAPLGGLAIGALFAGLTIRFTHAPSAIIFSVLAVLFVAGTLIAVFWSEQAVRKTGALQSLVPRLHIPERARREFLIATPVLIGAWMLGGLFLGLVPSITRGIFGVDNGLLNGFLIALQPGAGAISGTLAGRIPARRAIIRGAVILSAGILIDLSAITAHLLPLLFVGGAVSGTGFGMAFSAMVRTLSPLAEPHQRARLFATFYLVGYLAFGIPVLAAGSVIPAFGLLATVVVYAVVAMAVTVLGLFAQVRVARTELQGGCPSAAA